MIRSLSTFMSLACFAQAIVIHPDLPSILSDDDFETPLPLVIWHGLGDNYAADGLKQVGQIAEEINPGTFVYNIRMDEDPSADRSASFFGNLTLQVEKVCGDLAAHPILSTAPAIDALGFSQGGQFLRAYVERCNFPPVRSLVTFGSQHNGISEFQSCGETDFLCKAARALLRSNTWSSFVQSRLVPAQYFRDPNQYEQYLESSNFLADINNERAVKNNKYKENLEKLENFVMYVFEDDTTVIPKESGWFSEVNGSQVTPLTERAMYKEDWIGLRSLNEKGALQFKTTQGGHMSLSDKLLGSVFRENYGPLKKGKSLFTSELSDTMGHLMHYEEQLEKIEEKNKARVLDAIRMEDEEGLIAWPQGEWSFLMSEEQVAEQAWLLDEVEKKRQQVLKEQAKNFAERVEREHQARVEEL